MYTSATLVQQKTGKVMTADEASLFDSTVGPAITEWISNYIGATYDDDNGDLIVRRDGGSAAIYIGPVKDVSRVEYLDNETTPGEGDEIAAADYYIDGGYLFSYNRVPFIRGTRNVVVTAKFDSIPASIRLAATMMAVKAVQYKGAREVDSEKIGDYQVTYSNLSTQAGVAQLVDDNVLALLAPFKPIRLA